MAVDMDKVSGELIDGPKKELGLSRCNVGNPHWVSM